MVCSLLPEAAVGQPLTSGWDLCIQDHICGVTERPTEKCQVDMLTVGSSLPKHLVGSIEERRTFCLCEGL